MRKAVFLSFLSFFFLFTISCSPSVTEHGIFSKSRLAFTSGQDGVNPVKLNENTTMWTFGDTILATPGNGKTRMIANSLAFSDNPSEKNIRNLKMNFYMQDGKPAQFIKLRPGENPETDRLWAFDGIRIENNVYVYYIHLKITDPEKPMGFRVHSVGLARWKIPGGWKYGQQVNFKRLPNLFTGETPAFGACVIKKDGYLYLTGQFSKGLESPIKIARVPYKKVENKNAYTFLKADGTWTDNINKASSFLGDVAGECSISYNCNTSKFLITYCRIFTGEIVMVSFNNFSQLADAKKEIVFTPPKLSKQNIENFKIYYSGKEIYSEKNRVFAIYINPLEIQPHLLEISL